MKKIDLNRSNPYETLCTTSSNAQDESEKFHDSTIDDSMESNLKSGYINRKYQRNNNQRNKNHKNYDRYKYGK